MNCMFHRSQVPLGATGSYLGNSSAIIFTLFNITWKYTEFPNAISFYSEYDEVPLEGNYLFDLDHDPYETKNLLSDRNPYYYYSEDFTDEVLVNFIATTGKLLIEGLMF